LDHKVRNRETTEIKDIDAELRQALVKHEALLDSFCDDFVEEPVKLKKSEISNESAKNASKKPIDPKKKKTLLQALKEIDGAGNETFDK
jgi:hypothetical protein